MVGLDDVFVVVVGGDFLAGGIAKLLQEALALDDFAGGEGAEPVEIDDALLSVARAFVALGPFPYVAVEAHGGDVASRVEVHGVSVGDEV